MARETWAQISARKLENHPLCKICGIRNATQLHHGIIWRMKKFKKWIDVEENGIELCNTCHDGAQNYDTAQLVWDINLARYGAKRMKAFVNNLPFKIIPAWLRKKAIE